MTSKQAQCESALDRVIHYHPVECVYLDEIEDKEGMKQELEEIFEFFTQREVRDKSGFTHVNYGGVARTWYSVSTGRFNIDVDSLPTLRQFIVQLARWKVPLQLVECREKLTVFPLYFDIDIKLSVETEGEGMDAKPVGPVLDPLVVEKEVLDEKNGFRFIRIIARIIQIVFDESFQMYVYSASGRTSPLTGKVSFRLVFPQLVVDKEKAVIVREFLVQKLFNLSREESTVPFVRTFQKQLLQFSPSNHYRNVIDETAIRCRHGVRMIYNDKIEKGKPSGRIFLPLFSLNPVIEDEKINKLEILETPKNTLDDDLFWLQKASLVTPSLSHMGLTEWKRPNVRSSRVTRTGPGGSSLALTNMTTSDAVRAASRFAPTVASSDISSCHFDWPVGTISLFKRRIPLGIEGDLDISDDGKSMTWRMTRRKSNWIRFSEHTHVLEACAPNSDLLGQLIRIVEKFPQVTRRFEEEKVFEIKIEKVIRNFVVLKTHNGSESTELNIVQGEIVEFISTDESGWTEVRKNDNKTGYVPATYIKELSEIHEQPLI